MSDEDSAIVDELLERVIKKTVSQEEIQHEDNEDKQVSETASPLSLDYDDSDEPDNYKENQIVENGTSKPECDMVDLIKEPSEQLKDDEMNVDTNVDMNDDVGDHPEFVVEELVAKKVDENGLVHYFVKWKNFSSANNTWEPVGNLCDCDKVIEEFELKSARRLAEKRKSEDGEQNNLSKTSHARKKKDTQPKEYEVNDIMGLTTVQGEQYFLVSLANSTQKTFLRAKLANQIIPEKVIDFYIKNIKWKIV